MSWSTSLMRRWLLQAAVGVGGGLAVTGFAQRFGLQTAHGQLQDAQDTPLARP